MIVQHRTLDSIGRIIRELDCNGTTCLEVLVTTNEHHHHSGDIVIWAKRDTRTLFVPPTDQAEKLLAAI